MLLAILTFNSVGLAQVATRTLNLDISNSCQPTVAGDGLAVWYDPVGRFGDPLVPGNWLYTLNIEPTPGPIFRDQPLCITSQSAVIPPVNVAFGALDFDDSAASERLWAVQFNGTADFLSFPLVGEVWAYHATSTGQPASTPQWNQAFNAFSLRGQFIGDPEPNKYDGLAVDDADGTLWMSSDRSHNLFQVGYDGDQQFTVLGPHELYAPISGVEVKDNLVFVSLIGDNEIAVYGKQGFVPLARFATIESGFKHFCEDLDLRGSGPAALLTCHTGQVGDNPPPGRMVEFPLLVNQADMFLDTDADGIPDVFDNCPTRPNPSQSDRNGDGIGDACYDGEQDVDADGWSDDVDNCPTVYNPDQSDCDNDGIGDCCDPSQFCLLREQLLTLDSGTRGAGGFRGFTTVRDVVVADLDSDGDNDLVTAHQARYEVGTKETSHVGWVAVRWNLGGTRLSEPVKYAISTDPQAILCVDADADGHLDIVSADRHYILYSILPPGACPPSVPQPSPPCPPILLVPPTLSILYNDGYNRFGVAQRIKLQQTDYTFLCTDFVALHMNADSKIDFAVVGGTNMDPAQGPAAPGFLSVATWAPGQHVVTNVSLPGFYPTQVLAAPIYGGTYHDLVTLGNDGNVRLHRNDQNGGFDPPVQVPNVAGATAVAAGDYNGDGYADLIVGRTGFNPPPPPDPDVRVLLGQGNGFFFPTPLEYDLDPVSTPGRLALADMDNDNLLDIISVNVDSFTLSGPVLWPSSVSVIRSPSSDNDQILNVPVSDTTTALAVGRLGGDPFADVVTVGPSSSGVQQRASVVQNPAAGDMAPLIARALGDFFNPSTQPIAGFAADLDSQYALELITLDTSVPPASVKVFKSLPGGDYPQTPSQIVELAVDPMYPPSPSAMAVSEINGVDYDDVVVTSAFNRTQDPDLHVLHADATGTLAVVQQVRTRIADSDQPSAVVLGDANGDGKMDAMIAYDDGQVSDDYVLVVPGVGDGTFNPAAAVAFTVQHAPDGLVFVTLVGGDARPDLAVVNRGSNTISVLENQSQPGGPPAFAPALTLNLPAESSDPAAIAAAPDGAFLVTASDTNDNVTVFVNQGNGMFAAPVVYSVGDTPRSVAAVDIDVNGSFDVVTADEDANTMSILINNGDNTFGTLHTVGAGLKPHHVSARDVDGNGRPDLVNVGLGDGGAGSFVRVTYNTCICAACP